MGARIQVEAQGRTYTVVEDLTSIFEVLVEGTVVDEVTDAPIRTPLSLETARERVYAKALENGAFCLAGELEWVLPEHSTTPHNFSLTFRAPGYLPETRPISAPAAIALPIALPKVKLRPLPMRVQGRVVLSSTDRTGAADAIVRVDDAGTQGRLALRTALHADHPATTPVQRRTAVAGGTARTLARDAARGTATLALTGAAIAGTPVLGLRPQRELEFVPVAGPGPGAGEVQLTQPLTRSYPAGTPLDEFTFSTPVGAPVRRLTRKALAGDGLLLLDDVSDPAATAVQVGDAATGPIEFHAVGAKADSGGYYALDGVGGVTELTFRARPTPNDPPGPAVEWTLDYGSSPNLVDLQLAP